MGRWTYSRRPTRLRRPLRGPCTNTCGTVRPWSRSATGGITRTGTGRRRRPAGCSTRGGSSRTPSGRRGSRRYGRTRDWRRWSPLVPRKPTSMRSTLLIRPAAPNGPTPGASSPTLGWIFPARSRREMAARVEMSAPGRVDKVDGAVNRWCAPRVKRFRRHPAPERR